MNPTTTILAPVIKEISDNATLHIIDIDDLTEELKNLIDSKVIEIYSKGDDTDIEIVKIKMKNFLGAKEENGEKSQMGYIAEFFVHLYLNELGFSQECLFKNSETTNDNKKGFDGYYSNDQTEWIMESKSGKITTSGISHKRKISESYSDLKNKLSGNSNNNPWDNANTHAKLANTSTDILKNIKKLSDNYTKEIYADIKDFKESLQND